MNRLPIVCVIGYSNSGKTRAVVGLIQILTRRGYRVATAKHCHDGFQLDVEGKDRWQHKQAGAIATLMSGGGRIGLIQDTPESIFLNAIAEQCMRDADILFAEGFSRETHPKILVVSGETFEAAKHPDDPTIFAVISAAPFNSQYPQFSFVEMEDLTSLIGERFLK